MALSRGYVLFKLSTNLKIKFMETNSKEFKTETPGYYFTYDHKQHPSYRDQTEKWALLYEESSGQMISELNTEADKVNGMDAFTHKEVIGWFDSILNPGSRILSGVQLIDQERREQIEKHKVKISDDVNSNDHRELAIAAAALIGSRNWQSQFEKADILNKMPNNWIPQVCLHMAEKPYKERLVIAGALIAAEIDRLLAANE